MGDGLAGPSNVYDMDCCELAQSAVYGVKTTFWTFILSNKSYASTALARGMIFSNMKLFGSARVPLAGGFPHLNLSWFLTSTFSAS